MMLLAIHPWINIVQVFGIKMFKIWRDKGYPRKLDQNAPTTKCQNHQEYIELYAGDDFDIHT